jgi:hypothetical protein
MTGDSLGIEPRLIRGDGTMGADRSGVWRSLRWLLPIFFTLTFVVVVLIHYWNWLSPQEDLVITVGFGMGLTIFLSVLPAVLCVVQNVSRRRQLGKLGGLKSLPVADTVFFQTATGAIDSIRLVVDADYALPIFLLFLTTFVGFLAILVGFSRPDLFSTASVLLGGLQDRAQSAQFLKYQLDTFCVIAMAFVGSYVYALGRILDRINNNDLYPISLYYYVVRIVVACAAAAVVRHSFSVLADGADAIVGKSISADSAPLLLLVGFAIGFAPDLFILAISRRAFQYMKIWGTRDEPAGLVRPTSMPLLMIDDMTREKIDRLSELGIDSAQMLARQNPFLLLPRLPYDLGLLVDWIGQAQLYVLVKDDKLKALREYYVRDIFDLHVRLESDEARTAVCKVLGLSEGDGKALLQQLNEDPSYLRLRQVKDALRPSAA